jgi:hypothetical protein
MITLAGELATPVRKASPKAEGHVKVKDYVKNT